MKKHDLSNVMHRAWVITRATGASFAEALSESWGIYRLIRSMRQGVTRFAYLKTDGTIRHAVGTLNGITSTLKGDQTAKNNPKTVRYYDVEANGWRSFKTENFVAVTLAS